MQACKSVLPSASQLVEDVEAEDGKKILTVALAKDIGMVQSR